MDIDLLSKMVRELILDNDAVTLPGVGSFVADLVPSVFSDKGYTIHPPYRRLYFTPREGSDTLLVDLYAASNQVDRAAATRILVEFLAAMKEELKVRKTIVFPGLGRLRATRENHFFFVADEQLDIYPAGFGLPPISLKTHVETPDEVAAAVSGLAQQLLDPAPQPEPAPVEETVPEPEPPQVPAASELQFVDEPEDAPVPVDTPAPAEAPEPVEVPVEEPVEVLVDAPSEDPAPEPEPANTPEPTEEPTPEPAGESPWPWRPQEEQEHRHRHSHKGRHSGARTFWIVLGIIVGILLLLLLALAIIGHVAPEWLDPLLYTEEELEILRY